MRYNNPHTPANQLRQYFLQGGIPVTITLLALNVLTFLASFFSPVVATPLLLKYLAFNAPLALHLPWTFFTYPVVTVGFSLWMLVNWVFFWLSGGSLERSWGSTRYGIFFFALTAISAASLWIGGLIVRVPVMMLTDLFLPLTGLIVAFCMLNPTQTMVLYFFPIQARWLALLVTGLVFFQYGSLFQNWMMGVFACGGILAAYLYMQFGRSWAKPRAGFAYLSTIATACPKASNGAGWLSKTQPA
jgi:membrane associated rhomboid family serine protease